MEEETDFLTWNRVKTRFYIVGTASEAADLSALIQGLGRDDVDTVTLPAPVPASAADSQTADAQWLLDMRNFVALCPERITRRCLIGANDGATAALMLSVMVPVEMVFAFAPRATAALPLDLGRVRTGPGLTHAERYVFDAFDGVDGHRMLAMLDGWTNCLLTPPAFTATAGNDSFQALIKSLVRGDDIALPKGTTRIGTRPSPAAHAR